MPDISMCATASCPVRQACFRYRAAPNDRRQSYMAPEAWAEDNPCHYLMPIRKGDRTQPLAKADRDAAAIGASHAW
jgi:hypothetical protein